MKSELTALADFIAGQLIREGFVVQRYDSCTSDSIYLKLDYGVCNSIRISDHQGKKHLKYRYNIGPFVKEYNMEKDKFDRFYYRADKAKNMIRKILADRESKKSRYGEGHYRTFMETNKREKVGTIGFWKDAVLLNA